MNQKMIKWFLVFTLSILLWESASYFALSSHFPHIWIVVKDLFNLAFTLAFWKSLLITFLIAALGFTLGLLIAVSLGSFLALNRIFESRSRSVFNFLRSLPSVALLPLLIATWGSSLRTVLILTSFVVTCKLLLFVIRGIRDMNPALIEATEILHLPWHVKVGRVYIPSLMTILGSGAILAGDLAFVSVVFSGILAGTPGIGSAFLRAEVTGDVVRVFSYVIVMGLTGSLIYHSLLYLERVFKLSRDVV